MKAKEFLNQAYLLDQRIKSKTEQIQSLNELATKCTATLTGMPRNPNHGGSTMADAVCKIIDLQNEIAADMDRLVQIKKDIVDVIGKVDDAFILERINNCGSRPNESLSDAIERLSVCADKLRNTLSAEQRILLTDCENAYSVTDGETMNCYYRAGFSDAVLFLLGWRDSEWN